MLNERQLSTLRRIAEDEPPVTSAESALAVTVYALRSRGLVTTEHRGRRWSAAVTEAGRFFLDHGYHPDDSPLHGARQTAARQGAEIVANDEDGDITSLRAMLRLADNYDEFVLDDLTPLEMHAWSQACRALGSSTLRGYHVELREPTPTRLIARLVKDAPPPPTTRPAVNPLPVTVPVRLTRPHPVVAVLKRHVAQHPRGTPRWIDTRRHDGVPSVAVSRTCLGRVLRLLQALFTAAEQQGWTVDAVTGRDRGGVAIRVDGHAYAVAIAEVINRTPREPTAAELDRARRDPGYRSPRYDEEPSGRLRISLPSHHDGRRCRWTDGTRISLDEQLGAVLAEIKVRGGLDEQRRRQREAEADARRRAQRAAEHQAWQHAVQDHRADHLAGHVRDWKLAGDIRALCVAVEHAGRTRHGHVPAATGEWLDWARQYADSIDPIRNLPTLPDDPAPSTSPRATVENHIAYRRAGVTGNAALEVADDPFTAKIVHREGSHLTGSPAL